MHKLRTPNLILLAAVAIALVAYVAMREPSRPAVDATTGGGSAAIVLLLFLAIADARKRRNKNDPR